MGTVRFEGDKMILTGDFSWGPLTRKLLESCATDEQRQAAIELALMTGFNELQRREMEAHGESINE